MHQSLINLTVKWSYTLRNAVHALYTGLVENNLVINSESKTTRGSNSLLCVIPHCWHYRMGFTCYLPTQILY